MSTFGCTPDTPDGAPGSAKPVASLHPDKLPWRSGFPTSSLRPAELPPVQHTVKNTSIPVGKLYIFLHAGPEKQSATLTRQRFMTLAWTMLKAS